MNAGTSAPAFVGPRNHSFSLPIALVLSQRYIEEYEEDEKQARKPSEKLLSQAREFLAANEGKIDAFE